MAQYTIDIANCSSNPESQKVNVNDEVRFCSKDGKSYKLTGLANVFQGGHGHIDVPAGGCTNYYLVTGKKGSHGYNLDHCPPQGTPEIIIEN